MAKVERVDPAKRPSGGSSSGSGNTPSGSEKASKPSFAEKMQAKADAINEKKDVAAKKAAELAAKAAKKDKFKPPLEKDYEMEEVDMDPGVYPYVDLIEDPGESKEKQVEYRQLLDNIIRTTGSGSPTTRFQDVFYGMNRLNQTPELPFHKESQGLILFTKPDLNLAYDNISAVRQLSHLLTDDTSDIANAIRYSLDPSTQRGGDPFGSSGVSPSKVIESPLTDAYNPYMTLLSNTCTSMSQPPDLGISLYTSPEGRFREQFIMNDSFAENNEYYDLTCNFNNIQGNGVLMTFLTWILYMGYLRVGDLGPHPHNRMKNRIDYMTRIERFKTDESGRFITQWFHTGIAMPKSIGIGSSFALNRLEPYEFENKELSIQFGCVGAIYNDPIQLYEFNLRMIRWNPTLQDGKREKHYTKINPMEKALTNYYGYPLINLVTRELEWWILNDELDEMMAGIYPTDERDGTDLDPADYDVEGYIRPAPDTEYYENESYNIKDYED